MRREISCFAQKFVLDLLYPARCPVCDRPAPFGTDICPECLRALPVIETRRCAKCGKPVEEFEKYCEDCSKNPHVYTRGLGIFLYDEQMKKTMAALKYKGRREYGAVLGRLVYERARGELLRWRPQAIVPIPIHPDRKNERGYNQAEEIAGPIAELAGIRLCPDLLVRTERTGPMKKLTRAERFENMKDAIAVRGGCFVPDRVLIVDDIYTTGATIDAAAHALRSAGAREIYFLSVCIGAGFMITY